MLFGKKGGHVNTERFFSSPPRTSWQLEALCYRQCGGRIHMHGHAIHTEGWPETFADATKGCYLAGRSLLGETFHRVRYKSLALNEAKKKKRKTAQLRWQLRTFCTGASLPLFEMCPVTSQSTLRRRINFNNTKHGKISLLPWGAEYQKIQNVPPPPSKLVIADPARQLDYWDSKTQSCFFSFTLYPTPDWVT